jgi:arabinose-5-phosphate isomerase
MLETQDPLVTLHSNETPRVEKGPVDLLKLATRLIESEARALITLSETLGKTFVLAVNLISESPGRIVLTGIGKSGHIARKITSTLTSTGTAALFLHPSEASHGDLGTILSGDVVIAFSKSGESPELKALMTFCKQKEVPIIGVTADAQSSLAKASTIAIKLPKVPEACLHGLAPTSSSTMMLALGDALAIGCMATKGFSKTDFASLHPGGKLGRRLSTVKDLMHDGSSVPLIKDYCTIADSIIEMTRSRFGCVGITDQDDQLVGIFTDGDLRRVLGRAALTDLIRNHMTPNPVLLCKDDALTAVERLFRAKKIPSAFITENGRPIGIIHIHDLFAEQ